MGKKKKAFYAGFVAGETVDGVDQAWQTYKEDPDAFQPEADPDDEDADADEDADEDSTTA